MNTKKFISGLLALTMVFGGAVVPNAVVGNAVISASAAEEDVLTFGDYEYTLLEDGTVEIAKYTGTDAEVEIPAKIDGAALTSIGENAFLGIDSITKVVIPDGVTSIGRAAFAGCDNLESITMPNSLKLIKYGAFWGCGIESIVIPDSVEDIDGYVFTACHNLKNVSLPKNLKSLVGSTFLSCRSLESVTLPEGLENIGSFTFDDCENLDNVVIPDGLKSIGKNAFRYCRNLENIKIPENVTEIGENAFTDYVTINCYSGSYAFEYAKANGLKYKLIDEQLPACPPPDNLRAIYSEKYHQIRFYWEPVKGAEKYGLAVYLSGKWRVWTSDIPADVTAYTSPKNLTPGTKYKVCVAAKVNGKWNTSYPIKNAITVTVK
jgi:hypothetical protein